MLLWHPRPVPAPCTQGAGFACCAIALVNEADLKSSLAIPSRANEFQLTGSRRSSPVEPPMESAVSHPADSSVSYLPSTVPVLGKSMEQEGILRNQPLPD